MKVKVRKILLCVFFALFIVTLFTASFSLGRYSSVQSSESDYDDDFEYTLYDSIVVNTIDEFFAAISNGYNYIIIGDAIKDPLIIAGSMSDIRDDLIIDLNGHEIQRNSRDPLLNVTTGFTLTIIDKKGTGSMYNPVGSVIQVSGGTLTVQNGIFESGPRSNDSRNGDSAVNYNEYVQTKAASGELYSTPGGGSISSGPAAVTLYTNPIIYGENGGVNSPDSAEDYGTGVTANLPVIMPKFDVGADGDMTNGSMYFDSGTWNINDASPWHPYITNDTYLYYTFESDNMQYSTAADKSTANYYYQYYVEGGALDENGNYPSGYFTYAQNQKEREEGTNDNRILVTVYVYNDVKKYANNGYYPVDSSEDNTGFGAVKMQEGNLYVRGGTYYSYFGEKNTYCVESTGGLMTVNPTGSNAINFYAYQNGVCVECTVDTPTENEMLNISSGKFYSELGDTVRVENGNLVIGTADFTKDVGSADASDFGDNGDVIDISGGTLTINTRAGFDVSGSGVRGIYSHDGDNTSVRVANATFNFNTNGDSLYNAGIFARAGSVSCESKTTINFSSGNGLKAQHVCGIYSAGGTIECGIPQTHLEETGLTINIATLGSCENSYGIYANGGDTITHDTTNITIGNTGSVVTSSQGIHAENGEVNLGKLYSEGSVNSRTGDTTITVNGLVSNDENVTSSAHNFGIQTVGGHIYTYGTTTVTVYGTSSTGVYATVPDTTSASSINISGQQFSCNVYMNNAKNLSSTAISTAGGNITFNVSGRTEEDGTQIPGATINSDGLGITAFNMRVNEDGTLDSDNPITGSGNVTFSSVTATGATNLIDLNTSRGTAVYVQGGSVTINSGVTFNVESNTSQQLIWQTDDTTPHSHDGILVNGGSLIASGTFNVTHTGVNNDGFFNGNHYVTADNLKDWTPKSFAVRVEGDDNTDDSTNDSTKVQLNAGTIKNSVGGGLYVSGDTVVTLGTQGVTGKTLSIETIGTDRNSNSTGGYYDYWVNNESTWYNYDNLNGGDAVIVSGGKLDIYYGTYTAAFGNGIAVKDGTANVHGGLFRGNDPYTYSGRSAPAGAAASYAFKLYGGTANISGGTFGYEGTLLDNDTWDDTLDDDKNTPKYAKGGGAFVMGTSSARGTVKMTGGTINIAGTTGLGVWNNVDVTLGDKDTKTGPMVNAESTGITAESYSNGSSSITIYGGTYQSYNTDGGKNGIWYGEGKTTLKIHDGTFTGSGSSGSGLRMDAATPNSHTIVITGGNFNGLQAGLWYSQSAAVDDGLLIMGGTFKGNNYGVYLAQNPRSEVGSWWDTETYNNVAIVEGTFTGGNYAIWAEDGVKVGDVLTMHTAYNGQTYYATGTKSDGSSINGNAGVGGGGAVNSIGTSVTLTMQQK